jgi:hypothetical protein
MEGRQMKLITAIIKPFKLDEVREAPHAPRRVTQRSQNQHRMVTSDRYPQHASSVSSNSTGSHPMNNATHAPAMNDVTQPS